MKKLILWTIVLLLSFSIVYGSTQWPEYQKYDNNAGFQDPTYTVDLMIDTITHKFNKGSSFQPLSADLDNDGVNELILSSGNYIQLYEKSGNTLSLIDEINMGTGQACTGWTGSIINHVDANPRILMQFGNNMSVFAYNGTDFYIENSTTFDTCLSGLSCVNDVTYQPDTLCYSATVGGNITLIRPRDVVTSIYNISNDNIFSVTISGKYSPAMADIDRDGSLELGFIGISGNDEQIVMIEESTVQLDTGFSGDGYLIPGGTDPNIKGILMYNLNGAGDTETCITWDDRGAVSQVADDGYTTCYNSDGTVYGNVITCDDTSSATLCYMSTPVMMDVDNGGQLEVCVGAYRTVTGDDRSDVVCYEAGSSTLTTDYSLTLTNDTNIIGTSNNNMLIANDVNGDGIQDLIFQQYMFYTVPTGTTFAIANLISAQNNWYPIMTDLDGDSVLEYVGTVASVTGMITGNQSNEPPTIDNTLPYGGYTGFYTSPVCVNSTLIFRASEAGTNDNYDNDVNTDSEYINTNCGQASDGTPIASYTSGRVNGTTDLASPTYSCYYNNTGTYQVRLYLKDTNNPDDDTQYNNDVIVVNVINGIPGQTCSLADSLVTEPGQTPDPSPLSEDLNDPENIMDVLFNNPSDILKMIVGLGIVIGIIVAVAQYSKNNPFALALAGVLGLIMVTVAGLVSGYVLVLALVGIIMLFVLGKLVFGSAGTGGG